MTSRNRLVVAAVLAAWIFAPAGCGGDHSSVPTTPSSSSTSVAAPPPPFPDPNVIALQVGQVAGGVLHGNGPWCGMFDPLDTSGFPCQIYTVAAPSGGTIHVHLTWTDSDRTVCALPSREPSTWICKNAPPVDASYQVAGTQPTLAFAVGFEGSGPSTTLTPDMSVNYSVSASFVSSDTAERAR